MRTAAQTALAGLLVALQRPQLAHALVAPAPPRGLLRPGTLRAAIDPNLAPPPVDVAALEEPRVPFTSTTLWACLVDTPWGAATPRVPSG